MDDRFKAAWSALSSANRDGWTDDDARQLVATLDTGLADCIRTLRAKTQTNMPSTASIGAALTRGKFEVANANALHREYCRGKIDALNQVLEMLEPGDER